MCSDHFSIRRLHRTLTIESYTASLKASVMGDGKKWVGGAIGAATGFLLTLWMWHLMRPQQEALMSEVTNSSDPLAGHIKSAAIFFLSLFLGAVVGAVLGFLLGSLKKH